MNNLKQIQTEYQKNKEDQVKLKMIKNPYKKLLKIKKPADKKIGLYITHIEEIE